MRPLPLDRFQVVQGLHLDPQEVPAQRDTLRVQVRDKYLLLVSQIRNADFNDVQGRGALRYVIDALPQIT
jgi:hypothetical protein